jgi:hypothetical protein
MVDKSHTTNIPLKQHSNPDATPVSAAVRTALHWHRLLLRDAVNVALPYIT